MLAKKHFLTEILFQFISAAWEDNYLASIASEKCRQVELQHLLQSPHIIKYKTTFNPKVLRFARHRERIE
jgi:hypothetical protein